MKGLRSHQIVTQGVDALCALEHRGASGSEVNTGDGAGILIQIPDRFLREVVGFALPPEGSYATGIAFLPTEAARADEAAATVEKIAVSEGLRVLGWREVPVDDSMIGSTAKAVEPSFRQVFLAGDGLADETLERRVYIVRKRIEHEIGAPGAEGSVYFPSLSCRTLIYKGMLTTPQLAEFFPDLRDERVESALALVHSRFSTNTFPSWPLAHPFRYIAHNGEINTVQGNRNWMQAREALLVERSAARRPGADLPHLHPRGQRLGHLRRGARTAAHGRLLAAPRRAHDDPRGVGEPHPHERGHQGLLPLPRVAHRAVGRPGRRSPSPTAPSSAPCSTATACAPPATGSPTTTWSSWRPRWACSTSTPRRWSRRAGSSPGRMFLVDTAKGRIVGDHEIKAELAAAQPYQDWLDDHQVDLDDLPHRGHELPGHGSVVRRQQVFGYTTEELKMIIEPMARTGGEPLGSMGTDTPIAVLSSRSRLLFDYFTQLFAQVTNPPLDAIREELVTSIGGIIGPEGNLLDPSPRSCRQIHLRRPVIDNDELAKLTQIDSYDDMDDFRSVTVSCLFPVSEGGIGLANALAEVRRTVSDAIEGGANIIILSDRNSTRDLAPIPSLLATAAVHHHLIREKTRTRVGLVVECGDAREVHHMALLIGYGAAAVNPYLAFESIEDLIAQDLTDITDPLKGVSNYIKACGKGVLKVMSKMGISTVASYTGAQIFEAIGLAHDLVDEYFTGTVSRLGGVDVDELATEVILRHRLAHPDRPEERAHRQLEVGGEYQWRREGEYHLFNPDTVFKLQHATRTKRYEIFKDYTRAVDEQSRELATLRGLFRFREGLRPPVPIDEVESVADIVRRFSTGAMSYGSISAEAHETLAIAMNRIGARSNTGEGGEDPERFVPDANGDLRRSAIKQVASGRFGVTSDYLVNADDLQIKMAQGAKPGEGGQLPGHKVYPWIAKTRHSTPGVGLISPPPHHDIYSIEDLAQLIHDLKNANPVARVHVKLVAEVGVGTVAAGVSKAHADVVLISGHDGGTGASPLTSLKHAGAPWELGLAETQQTLLLNGLRDRIVVQVDGQLKTGRDVVIGALLGGRSSASPPPRWWCRAA